MSSKPKQKARLTEEIIIDYKTKFEHLDPQSTGKISVQDIPTLMRDVGLMPSNMEIEELLPEVDKEKNAILEGINFQQFCELAAMKFNDVYTETEILDAFRTFDVDNNGFLPASELRRTLCTMGESLTDDEIDTMLKTATVDSDGNVLYEEFVHKIMLMFERSH